MKLKEYGIVDGSREEKYIYYKDDVFKIRYKSSVSILAAIGLLKKTKVDYDYKSEDYKNMIECEVYDSLREADCRRRINKLELELDRLNGYLECANIELEDILNL